MVGQINREKVDKYFYRLRKAFGQNNKEKSQEYLSHLKYHVMVGGVNEQVEQQITNKLGQINQLIDRINQDAELTKEHSKAKFDWVQAEKDKLKRSLEKTREELQTTLDTLAGVIESAKQASTIAKTQFDAAITTKDEQIRQLEETSGLSETQQGDAIKELTRQVAKQSEEIKTKDARIEELQNELDKIIGEKAAELEAEKTKSTQVLNAEKARSTQELTELRHEMSAMRDSVKGILTTTKDNMNIAIQKVAALKSANTSLLAEMQKQTETIANLTSELAKANQEKEEAIEGRRKAWEESATAQQQAQDRLKELDSIITSLRSTLKVVKVDRDADIKFYLDKKSTGRVLLEEEKAKLRRYREELLKEKQESTELNKESYGSTQLKNIAEALGESVDTA